MTKQPDLAAPGLLSAARACYGGLLLCTPRRMISLAAVHPAGSRAAAVARVLGVRHLVQAALTAVILSAGPVPAGIGRRMVLQAGAAVDTAHAASMIALGLADPPLRRAAWADALLEAGLASFGIMTARLTASPRVADDRWKIGVHLTTPIFRRS